MFDSKFNFLFSIIFSVGSYLSTNIILCFGKELTPLQAEAPISGLKLEKMRWLLLGLSIKHNVGVKKVAKCENKPIKPQDEAYTNYSCLNLAL